MPAIVLYFLKVSVSLAIVWVFYQLLLRRLTFYTLNRWYLLGYSVLAFFIPLVDLGPLLGGGERSMVLLIPSIGEYGIGPVAAKGWMEDFGSWNWLVVGMMIGAMVLLVRLVVRWASLYKIRRGAQLVRDGGVKVYQVEGAIRPFSFGDAIYINPRLHTEKEWSEIVLHEYVHIRGRHSFDILFSELLCILNWYNPFVWLIRYSVRQNLEFIADRTVLENGVDKKGYQYHLLKVVGDQEYHLANNFNFSSLKKRIIMMNKIRSARLHLLKFLFILPLMGVLLVAFRSRLVGEETLVSKKDSGNMVYVDAGQVLEMKKDVKKVARKQNVARVVMNADTGRPVQIVPSGEVGKDPVKVSIEGALYVVDGEVLSSKAALDSLTPDKIYAVEVLKGEQGFRYYGSKGSDGVVVITTKEFKKWYTPAINEKRQEPADQIKLSVIKTVPPIFIIDGVEKDEKAMKVLNPNDIGSIEVLKGEKAMEKYGEKGRNGVIIIHLKKKGAGDSHPVSMKVYDKKGETRYAIDPAVVRTTPMNFTFQLAFQLDKTEKGVSR